MGKINIVRLVLTALALLVAVIVLMSSGTCVPSGHVGVVQLFGQVDAATLDEGYHLVNPFCKVTAFDVREKTHKETASVPSRDQLSTEVDVSVQYRIDKTAAARMLKETGTPEDAVEVHLIPKLRSVMREQGKTIDRAEDFFHEDVQQKLQTGLLTELQSYLQPKGIIIEAVLIREIRLPTFIIAAIQSKKVREQEGEKQKAELDRYKTEQEQKIAAASAERQAAEEEAKKTIVLAQAQAQEIELTAAANAKQYELEGAALRKNPEVIRLEWLKRWNGVLPHTILASDARVMMQMASESEDSMGASTPPAHEKPVAPVLPPAAQPQFVPVP